MSFELNSIVNLGKMRNKIEKPKFSYLIRVSVPGQRVLHLPNCINNANYLSQCPQPLLLPVNQLFILKFHLQIPVSTSRKHLSYPLCPFQINCAEKAQRTGKLRYPSEKKKLRLQKKAPLSDDAAKNSTEGIWRLSRLGVSVHEDPGRDSWGVSEALLREIARVLEFPVASMLPPEAFTVVRKSFDARKLQKEPKFVYTVDMDVHKLISLEPRTWEFVSELEPKVGFVELLRHESSSCDLISILRNHRNTNESTSCTEIFNTNHISPTRKPKVVVVGSGPSGLFATLVLAEVGADVTLVERGQAVEQDVILEL